MAVRQKHLSPVSTLGERERQFASLVWRRGKLGRREIHQITGVHPTLTGNAVAALIDAGLLREGDVPPAADRGRPQVPLEIDPDRRSFLGLSISPGMVRVATLDPLGRLIDVERSKPVARNARLIDVAAALLADQIAPSVFAIGVSFTGLVDSENRQIVFSSAQPSSRPISLQPIYEAAGSTPVVLHNDMHALSLRWLLKNGSPADDVLLVGLSDGGIGASVLFDGRPHEGRLSAANELGHTRLAVPTETCYCGHEGCLERIFSSAQLTRLGVDAGVSLEDALGDPGPNRAALDQVLDHLATGLGNAVNFIRPDTLVVSSALVKYPSLRLWLRDNLPPQLLPGLRERVEILFEETQNMRSAENAAWLALADIFGRPVTTAGD